MLLKDALPSFKTATYNICAKYNITTVKEALQLSDTDLLKTNGVGKVFLSKLRALSKDPSPLETLRAMPLHTQRSFDNLEVTRVPSGWIYHFMYTCVFVPEC